MKNTFKLSGVFITALILTGCSGEDVQSIEWYAENTEARTTTLENCQTSEGNVADTPNCQNALQAALQASTGSRRTFNFNRDES